MIRRCDTIDPAMLKLREALVQQKNAKMRKAERYLELQKLRTALYEQKWKRPSCAAENVSHVLNAYADERRTARPSHVKWGCWTSAYLADDADATDTDIVVAFELSEHFPKGEWRSQYRLPRISREMNGYASDLRNLEDTAIEWGKGIIDRIADSSCLLPAEVPEEFLSWLPHNCVGSYHLTELDPNPAPWLGLPSDDDCYPYFAARCLWFEDEADAILFKLRWL